MGGKTATTSSATTIPPEVLARYNSVNATAEKAAAQPFQQYSTDPNAFVAPINQQQQLGINATNQYANAAQNAYQGAMGQTNQAADTLAQYGQIAQQGYQQAFGAAGQAQADIQNYGQTAQPYFQQAQGLAQGAMPQYGYASGYANQAMTPLQQATYAAQPSYQTAQAGTLAAGLGLSNIAQGYNAPNYAAGVQGYMNPYLQNAMGSTAAMMQNQNQQQQQQLLGNAISQGAFGGDRGQIAQAALMGQQNLAMGQTLGQMANQGYQSSAQNYLSGLGAQAGIAGQQGALANQYGQLGGATQQALINAGLAQGTGAGTVANIAAQQMAGAGQYGALGTAAQNAALQPVGLEQQQAQLLGQLATGQQNAALQSVPMQLAVGAQMGALGTGQQAAGLAGAQAQIGAGTLQQQTQQAGLTALYNQFQQQQAYPFQVAQFLANIAEGTGSLSGSQTTTTQPASIFSDERLKEDVEPIGETYDGQKIVKFRYKGEKGPKQIGLIAQDVEKHHPDAVGLASGYKTVDYDAATKQAAKRGHFYAGGIAGESMGGHVHSNHSSEGYMPGGIAGREHHASGDAVGMDPNSMAALLAGQRDMYAPFSQAGIYGQAAAGLPGGGKGIVPQNTLPVRQLMTSNAAQMRQPDNLTDAANLAKAGKELYGDYKYFKKEFPMGANNAPQPLVRPDEADTNTDSTITETKKPEYRGGIAFAAGGSIPYNTNDPLESVIENDNMSPTERRLMQASQNPALRSSSGIGDLANLVSLGKDVATIGSGVSSALAYLPTLFAADGGAINREHHDCTEGNVVGNNNEPSIADIISSAATNNNVDPAIASRIAQIESSYNPKAQNKLSSAGGLFGLINDNVPEGVDKYDPKANAEAGTKLIASNQEYLKNNNIEPTPGATYLAHFLGADRAKQVLTNTDTPLEQILPKSYFEANPSLAGKTGSDLVNWSESLMAGKPMAQTRTPAGSIAGGGGQASLFDKLSQEENYLPILAGIGTMASSRSPYLGAAVLQGLGGYATTAMEMQKQQSEIAKNTMGLAAQRFTPVGGGMYYDRTLGDTVPLAVYQSRLAQMPGMAKYMGAGAPSPTAGGIAPKLTAPAAGGIAAPAKETDQGAATTAQPAPDQAVEAAKAVTPAGTSPSLVGQTQAIYSEVDKDPKIVAFQKQVDDAFAKAQAYTDAANDPANIATGRSKEYTSLATATLAQANLAKGQLKDMRDKLASVPLAQLQKQAELPATTLTPELYKANLDVRKQAQAEALQGNAALQRSQAMMDRMFDPKTGQALINTGPWGEQANYYAAVAKQAGFSDNFIKNLFNTNPANNDEVEKLRTSMAAEISRLELQGSPVRVSEFNRFLSNTPGNSILPEAFKFINGQIIQPQAKSQMKAYEALKGLDPTKDDFQNAYYEQQRDNPWYSPQSQAAQPTATAPAATAITPEQAKAELARRQKAKAGVQ